MRATVGLSVSKSFGGSGALRFKSSMLEDEEMHSFPPSSSPLEAGLAYRREHDIIVRGDPSNESLPMTSFEETPFTDKLKGALSKMGYERPTPTQAQSWPILMAGRDLISVARTGAGKTVGFLLPAFQMLSQGSLRPTSDPEDAVDAVGVVPAGGGRHNDSPRSRDGEGFARPNLEKLRRTIKSRVERTPRVLVLAPTRELTKQIEAEARKFGKVSGHHCMSVYGGAPKGEQIRSLRVGVDMVVATPGRCYDLMKMGYLQTDKIEYLVLDEADQMLDFGFMPQIERIIADLPKNRQSIFFTATWPDSVRALASKVVNDPLEVKIANNNQLTANKNITQAVFPLTEMEKEDMLVSLLNDTCATPGDVQTVTKTLVFANRKDKIDGMKDSLRDAGFRPHVIHGDVAQVARERVMARFRKDKFGILLATDVAARGLDISDIRMVVNYDMPAQVEQYVHRIGRTGRAERDGYAVTFFTRGDQDTAAELAQVMARAGQEVPPDLLAMADLAKNRRGGRGGRGGGRGGGYRGGGGRGGGGGGYRGDRGGGGGGGGGWRSGGDRGGGGGRGGGDRGGDRGGGRGGGGGYRGGGDRGGDRSSLAGGRRGGGGVRGGRGGDRRGGGDRGGGGDVWM